MNNPARIGLSLLLAGGMTATLPAQDAPPPPPSAVTERSPDDLDDLLGPIALYPDDLVAIILPAAAQPTDIVLAARYLDNNGAMEKLDEQVWDESVRALAHFPDVVEWMNKNLAWTQAVGDAFALQPAAVMKSIQRLRAKAYAAGTLRDTEQQKILVDGNVIRIVSAKEDVIYVPRYRTEVVYVDHPVHYYEPWITFGIGWAIGSWYHWGCDWYGYNVWVFDHHDHWHDYRSHYYYGGYYNHGHNYNHGNYYNHGHAWCAPRSHARYHHGGGSSHGNYNGNAYRPGPYVEDESRHRNWNRGGNSNGGNPSHGGGFTGDGHPHERKANNNTNDPNRPERRPVDPHSGRGTPDGNRNPRVIVNNGGTPNNATPPVVTDPPSRNGRNRDNTFNRGSETNTGGGDSSRRPRTSPPANPTGPAVVATPNSAPPAVTSSGSRSNGRSSADNTTRHDYTQRSRQDTQSGSGSNRTVRAYAPERSNAVSTPNAGRDSRSDSTRSSPSSSRRYNDTFAASTATTTTSSSHANHSGGGSGRSYASTDSGRSRGSDSGRSTNSSGGDGGGDDRGGRSTGHSGGGGGGGRGR